MNYIYKRTCFPQHLLIDRRCLIIPCGKHHTKKTDDANYALTGFNDNTHTHTSAVQHPRLPTPPHQHYFDLLRAVRAPLLLTAMAFVLYGFVLVQVQGQATILYCLQPAMICTEHPCFIQFQFELPSGEQTKIIQSGNFNKNIDHINRCFLSRGLIVISNLPGYPLMLYRKALEAPIALKKSLSHTLTDFFLRDVFKHITTRRRSYRVSRVRNFKWSQQKSPDTKRQTRRALRDRKPRAHLNNESRHPNY